jgi:hypothetical protein
VGASHASCNGGPEAGVDDLDLDDEADVAIWDARMDAVAERRIQRPGSSPYGFGWALKKA